MNFILRDCCPPLVQVSKLGSSCSQVYAVLWESAYCDVRGDCGGTTKWTIKGIAGELGACRKRIAKALDQLLDNGFIIAEGYKQDGRGSKITIWRVVHPAQLEARKAVIEFLGSPYERRQMILDHKIDKPDPDLVFEEAQRQDYIDNFGVDPEGLWDAYMVRARTEAIDLPQK